MKRILLLSDIHGNSIALKSILEKERFDDVWVVGDLVDYGPDPGEVIDLVRELDPPVIVRGNHDHAAAYRVDCGCGPATHDLSVLTREKITLEQLSSRELAWLGSLPLEASVACGGHVFHVTHGSPLDPLHHYFYYHSRISQVDRVLEKLKEEYSNISNLVLIHGHTHFQGYLSLNGSKIVNPGSAGQPRDGDPRAAYAVLVCSDDRLEIALARLKYDAESVVSRLKGYGLPEHSVEKLKNILLRGGVF